VIETVQQGGKARVFDAGGIDLLLIREAVPVGQIADHVALDQLVQGVADRFGAGVAAGEAIGGRTGQAQPPCAVHLAAELDGRDGDGDRLAADKAVSGGPLQDGLGGD
jgi:hypothetical protein